MIMPRPDDDARRLFDSVLPDDPRVSARPMFGNVAGFVKGNMFTGLFGNDLFVRLSEADRSELLVEPGATVKEPMTGRPMKEYVVLPTGWRDAGEEAQEEKVVVAGGVSTFRPTASAPRRALQPRSLPRRSAPR